MPMVDVYAADGTFSDKHAVAKNLAAAVMRWEKWVLITESPEGGWGMNGHANTGADMVAAARHALAQK